MSDENIIEDAVVLNEDGIEVKAVNVEEETIEAAFEHGMEKLFLAGPVTGIEYNNYPLFSRVATEFRNVNFQVCSPAEFFDGKGDRERKEYMLESIKWLLEADTIVLLPGWEKSPGAYLLASIAKELELICVEYAENDSDVPFIEDQDTSFIQDDALTASNLGGLKTFQEFTGAFTPVEVDQDGNQIVTIPGEFTPVEESE